MKKILAAVLAVTMMGTMMVGCAKEEEKVFTIAYAPNESTTESADARYSLADDLGEALGIKVEEIQASDYNAIIEALRTGQADMAYLGAQSIALALDRSRCYPHRYEGSRW